MRQHQTAWKRAGARLRLRFVVWLIICTTTGPAAGTLGRGTDADETGDTYTPRIKIGVAVAVFPSANTVPDAARQLLQGHSPPPRAMTVATSEFQMPWKKTVQGYGFGTWDSSTPIDELGTITAQYPDFASNSEYNRPLQRTFIETYYEATPGAQDASVRLQARFELMVVNEERTAKETAGIGGIDVQVAAGSIVLVYLGTLSQLDDRVPDETIRAALHNDDRLTFGKEREGVEPTDAYILQEDRTTSHVILRIEPSILIPNTTREAIAAYELIDQVIASEECSPHPDSIVSKALRRLADEIRWGDDSWRLVIEDRIARNDPDLPRGVRLYAAWLYERRCAHRFLERELEAAEASATRSIDLDPQRVGALLQRAESRWVLGKMADAASDVKQALALAPKNAAAWSLKGSIEYERGRDEPAIEAFTRALELSEDDPSALLGRGCALQASGEPDRARADFERFIELMPEDPIGYVHLSSLLAEQGDTDAALVHLKHAVELDPSHSGARYWRAHVQRMRGDLEAALEDLTVFVAQAPEDPHRRLDRGRVLFDLGRPDAAVAELLEACRVGDPEPLSGKDLDYAQFYLWIASAQSGHREQADQRLKKHLAGRAARLDPWPADVGRALLGELQPDALLARASDSIESQQAGRFCEARFYIGILHLLEGRTGAAQRSFRAAIATGQRDFIEYESAKAVLARMSGGGQ